MSDGPADNFVDREAALLGRFARVKLPALPTRRLLPEVCPEYSRQLDVLQSKYLPEVELHSDRLLLDYLPFVFKKSFAVSARLSRKVIGY